MQLCQCLEPHLGIFDHYKQVPGQGIFTGFDQTFHPDGGAFDKKKEKCLIHTPGLASPPGGLTLIGALLLFVSFCNFQKYRFMAYLFLVPLLPTKYDLHFTSRVLIPNFNVAKLLQSEPHEKHIEGEMRSGTFRNIPAGCMFHLASVPTNVALLLHLHLSIKSSNSIYAVCILSLFNSCISFLTKDFQILLQFLQII